MKSIIGDYFRDHRSEMLQLLKLMVETESPTTEPHLANNMGALVQDHLRACGAAVTIDKQRHCGHHVIGRYGPQNEKKPILLIGHLDTVWKEGTIDQRPFFINGDLAFGPGALDMKAGLVIMLFALKAINALSLVLQRPLTLVFNSDEEMRSEYSRELIFREARHSNCALVFEGSNKLEAFTTSRNASGRFFVETHGKAAHAGAAIAQGVNAIEEMAYQVQSLQRMTDLDVGTTVNVGIVSGGNRPNIVPDWAEAAVSVRAPTQREMDRIARQVLGLQPVLKGASVRVRGNFHRGPFEPSHDNDQLFRELAMVASAFGLEVVGQHRGGASDANLTSSVGTPTIDGMGAVGEGAHSADEHVQISSLGVRAAMATELITRRA